MACMFLLKALLLSGYVVPHTDPQSSVWLYHHEVITSLCFNCKECKQHLASASFRRIYLGVFSEWETEKREMLENRSFCTLMLVKQKLAFINTNMHFYLFFTARWSQQQPCSRLQVSQTCHIEYTGIGTDKTLRIC